MKEENTGKPKIKINKDMIFLLLALALVLWFWRCPFRTLGLSCPGCGMTSAFLALARLKFKLAFYFHPLWPLVIVTTCYLVARYFKWFMFSERNEQILLVVIMVVFVVVYLYRLLIIKSPVVEWYVISLR